MKTKLLIVGLTISVLLLTGCAAEEPESAAPAPISQPQADQEELPGYPAPAQIEETESGYPIIEATFDLPKGPEFHIDRPVSSTDFSVTGTGPANVPIILVNVSKVGDVLADTIINEQGTFVFQLDQALIAGHTIGIQLGNIEGTEFEEDQFVYSETYFDRPYVGILFDLVVVE